MPVHLQSYLYFQACTFLVVRSHIQIHEQNIQLGSQTEAGKMMVLGRHEIGYNTNVLQQTSCLVVNPIMVGNFAFLFNCTPMGRTSDSMMVRLKDLSIDEIVGA